MAIENSDHGVNLTEAETALLAQRLIARRAADDEWLLWEDVPLVGEFAFERLEAEVKKQAEQMARNADNGDLAAGIDTRDLLSRLQ